MKLAQIVVMQETGEVVYEGSLKTFIRENEEYPGHLVACLRDGMKQSPPEPALIGGGAAPAFYVSLAA